MTIEGTLAVRVHQFSADDGVDEQQAKLDDLVVKLSRLQQGFCHKASIRNLGMMIPVESEGRMSFGEKVKDVLLNQGLFLELHSGQKALALMRVEPVRVTKEAQSLRKAIRTAFDLDKDEVIKSASEMRGLSFESKLVRKPKFTCQSLAMMLKVLKQESLSYGVICASVQTRHKAMVAILRRVDQILPEIDIRHLANYKSDRSGENCYLLGGFLGDEVMNKVPTDFPTLKNLE